LSQLVVSESADLESDSSVVELATFIGWFKTWQTIVCDLLLDAALY